MSRRGRESYFAKATRETIYARTLGFCAAHRCKMLGAHYDHIIPVGLWPKGKEGCNDAGNGQLLCYFHHHLKTASDMAAIAKSNRIRKREAGEHPPRRITRWRRFNGTIVSKPRERSNERRASQRTASIEPEAQGSPPAVARAPDDAAGDRSGGNKE